MGVDAAGDREVLLMGLIVEGFAGLDDGARRRVCRWFIDRFAKNDQLESTRTPSQDAEEYNELLPPGPSAHSPRGLEALYATAKTTAQWERALIAGYWLHEKEGQTDFDAQTVNQAMRRCGYGVSNITRELNKLTSGRLVEVQSENGSRRGRRRFRVTREGVRWIKQRIAQTEG